MRKKYIVYSPVNNFCGVGAAGVQFAYGKATVNEGWVLEWYKEHGYKIEEVKEVNADSKKIEEVKEVKAASKKSEE